VIATVASAYVIVINYKYEIINEKTNKIK